MREVSSSETYPSTTDNGVLLSELQNLMDVGDIDLRLKEAQEQREAIESSRWKFARLVGIPDEVLTKLNERQTLPRPSSLEDTINAFADYDINAVELSKAYDRVLTFRGEKVHKSAEFLKNVLGADPGEIAQRQPRMFGYSPARLLEQRDRLIAKGITPGQIGARPHIFSKKSANKLGRVNKGTVNNS